MKPLFLSRFSSAWKSTTSDLAALRALALILGLVALGSLGFAGLKSKELLNYQIDNPAGAPFLPDRCGNKGLVAHWKFDDMTAESTPDESGQGNVGIIGRPLGPLAEYRFKKPQLVPGRIGNAVDLQKRQWVLAENSACFTTEESTVMAWVWMESAASVPTIAAKSSWPQDGWWLCTTSTPIFPQDRFLDLGIAWAGGRTHVKSGYQVPLHEWHHVAVTMDNVRHEVQFFVDGLPYGGKHTDVHRWNVNFKNNFAVGDYDGTGRWPWHGKIDDVRVYNRVASAEEIKKAFLDAPV